MCLGVRIEAVDVGAETRWRENMLNFEDRPSGRKAENVLKRDLSPLPAFEFN